MAESPPPTTESGGRLAYPFLALAASFGAAAMFAGGAMVSSYLGGRGFFEMLVAVAAVVMALAGVCLLVPMMRGAGLILVWNGLGLGIGLLAVGIFSVGALVAFPVVMIAIAMSSWPRAEGDLLVTAPAIIALVGGVAIVSSLFWLPDSVDWLADRLGGR